MCAQVEIQLYAYAVYKLCSLPFRYTITKVVLICPPPFEGITHQFLIGTFPFLWACKHTDGRTDKQNETIMFCLAQLSGGATPGRASSNNLAGRSTALAQVLAPPCLALRIALLR